MMIPALQLLLWFLSLLVVHHTSAESFDQLVFTYHKCNNDLGNFTIGDTYDANRNALLSAIYLNRGIDYGFYNFSAGQEPEKINGIGLCRGDVAPDDCHTCLKSAAVLLSQQRCPNQKEAIGWYDQCMIRYSNRSIFHVMEFDPNNVMCSTNTITTGVDVFSEVASDLLGRLRNKTISSSGHKVAEGSAMVQGSNNETVYALLQCTPDLPEENCAECLDRGFSQIRQFCEGKKGGRYIGPSCSARYENYSFFGPILGVAEPAPAPAPQPPQEALPPQLVPPSPSTLPSSITPEDTQGKSKTSRTVVAIVVPVVAVVLLIVLVCIIYLRARKARERCNASSEGEADNNDIKTAELTQFDFETIRVATDNFSDVNKLGQGGFGTVYKGMLLDGQEVAIKRLSHNSGQGQTEFKNEVLLTGKLQHRNLVRLLGFCLERRERILVYEFVPNKSLDYIIFDPIKHANLNWETRFKIIKGIVRGLIYLHEDSRLQVVHRDLKISNILLDEELNPKISDFGMARLFDVNQAQGNTSTIVGTIGYMAPEYIKHGQFSVKSDVFSFGVMILEILYSQKNNQIFRGEVVEDLLSFAWRNWKEGTALNIVDGTLLKYVERNEIMRCIHIGLLCVQEDVAKRPTMTTVLLMLDSISFPLPDPSEPPFLMRVNRSPLPIPIPSSDSEATKSSDSRSQSAQGPTNKAQITDVYPR